MRPRVSLMDVHNALSHLCFAVREALSPLNVSVRAEYNPVSFLSLEIECRGKDVQRVDDQLAHGVLMDDYDYRFTVSSPVGVATDDWTFVRAYPDMMHDDRRTSRKIAAA